MKVIRLKTKEYKILIGKNALNNLALEIRKNCPKCNKIAVIFDKKVPRKFLIKIKKILKKYKIFIILINSSEKIKSIRQTNLLLEKLFNLEFNRSDTIIGVGGGITGDLTGFVASIFKRGINFVNIPTTLLAQVDSCIGGKTGVNTNYGKNLIGSFYHPKVVISDNSFLNSLPHREIICGYAEILKHAIIKDKKFFNWLKSNTHKILMKDEYSIIQAIKRSSKIKLYFTEKDFKEKKIRMILNFGHTFAHAIEAKNRYSKKINHGEAVLVGMMIALKISFFKKICTQKVFQDINDIYKRNNLIKNLSNFLTKKEIKNSIKFMANDKKNNDERISLILLKKIGKTSEPGKFKFAQTEIKNIIDRLF